MSSVVSPTKRPPFTSERGASMAVHRLEELVGKTSDSGGPAGNGPCWRLRHTTAPGRRQAGRDPHAYHCASNTVLPSLPTNRNTDYTNCQVQCALLGHCFPFSLLHDDLGRPLVCSAAGLWRPPGCQFVGLPTCSSEMKLTFLPSFKAMDIRSTTLMLRFPRNLTLSSAKRSESTGPS